MVTWALLATDLYRVPSFRRISPECIAPKYSCRVQIPRPRKLRPPFRVPAAPVATKLQSFEIAEHQGRVFTTQSPNCHASAGRASCDSVVALGGPLFTSVMQNSIRQLASQRLQAVVLGGQGRVASWQHAGSVGGYNKAMFGGLQIAREDLVGSGRSIVVSGKIDAVLLR